MVNVRAAAAEIQIAADRARALNVVGVGDGFGQIAVERQGAGCRW